MTNRMSATIAVAVLAIAGFVTPVRADWNPGDSYKMHYPQLPDPLGWDVAVATVTPPPPAAVADDWLCTETGPVSDIHIWFSMRGDAPPIPSLMAFTIWSDVPDPDGTGPAYSTPGTLLWNRIFAPFEFTIRPYGTGQEGWYDPNNGIVVPNDHFTYWQLNLNIDPLGAFVQQEGEIYWLGVNFEPTWGNVGWKTSQDHFNDDAVYWDFAGGGGWQELLDPVTHESLDMAFVITTIPEPSTVMLVGFGVVGLLAINRRKKS